ncbi:hypoxia-inducible factor 1-alpha inhibitor-like isoform X1 [Planococcus citri]|uniref:hypoxia-inducible factor 1-alpha inhibitor-like isoform X1 n=2 Tax=Planococcus citri TaxID=170843 RepID=UPI0031F85004
MGEPSYNESQLREYPIKLEKIPKLSFDDSKIDDYITANEPIVIQGSNLVDSAKVWDLDYLKERMNGKYTVIISKDHKFKYHDEKKLKSDFEPLTKRVQMKFEEFVDKMKNWKEGEERYYFQQVLDNSVGVSVVQDFVKFNWDWFRDKTSKNNWGPLTSNLLLIAMEGNVTPCHYDEQQNFYAQLRGYKRIMLFKPSQFENLYPHPVHHPYDRQTQIDFENPDYEKFPRFKNLSGFETIIEPGEVLYIPMYWFHHVESLIQADYTMSINFWYKAPPTGQIVYPLKDHQKVAIMRNVEKMLREALGDPDDIGPLLRTIIEGRYIV